MRTQVFSLYFILLSLLVASCDVLDQVPESDITSTNFWQTPKDAESGLVAVYNLYRGNIFLTFQLGEIRSDNLETPPKWGYEFVNPQSMEFNYNIVDANSGFANWNGYYNAIARANEVIYYTSNKIPFSVESDKLRIIGEALFLRASSYFNLAKNWGDVPLITEPFFSQGPDMYVARTPVNKVYEQIVADLVLAEQYLPTTRTDGMRIRATKAAAQALYCDVLLTRGYTSFAASDDFTNVITMADKVLVNTNYRLLIGANYSDIFRLGNTNESIFEIWSDYEQSATQGYCNYFLPRAYDHSRPYGGECIMVPSHSLDNAYKGEPDDLRYGTTIAFLTGSEAAYYDKNNENIPYGNKYLGTVTNPGIQRYSDDNVIIYRLPDVILSKAEALIKTGKASEGMDLVNDIRERAGLGEKTASSDSEALDILLAERRKEFAFEGKRWYDLVRTNKVDEFKTEPEFVKGRLLVPVPQTEIDKNPLLLPQNPTY